MVRSTDEKALGRATAFQRETAMKQMEYTIKVVTKDPIDVAVITDAIVNSAPMRVQSAEVTNYRVIPMRKESK